MENEFDCEDCKDVGTLRDGSGCQSCCQHCDVDHGSCMDCGADIDPGLAIDAAMDFIQDR